MIKDPMGRGLRVVSQPVEIFDYSPVTYIMSDKPRLWTLNRRFHPRALRSESWTGRSPYAGSLLDVVRRIFWGRVS